MLCSTRVCAVTYGNGERRQHSGPSDVRFFPTLTTLMPFRRTANDSGRLQNAPRHWLAFQPVSSPNGVMSASTTRRKGVHRAKLVGVPPCVHGLVERMLMFDVMLHEDRKGPCNPIFVTC